MDEDGYLFLSDFGTAEILKNKTSIAESFFGDLDYQPPEMLLEEGHSFPVDWWAVGVLTYQMVFGFIPFVDDDIATHGNNIVNGDLMFPVDPMVSTACRDFITKCLDKLPEQRLGSKNGLNDLLSHDWLKQIDHCSIAEKTEKPPMKPDDKT